MNLTVEYQPITELFRNAGIFSMNSKCTIC